MRHPEIHRPETGRPADRPGTSFEALADSAPDAILTIDERSTILSANPAVERVFGWPPDEIVGRSLAVLIPERLRGAHDAGIARYLRTGSRNIPWTGVQLPALTRDGRELPVEISFGEFVDAEGRRIFSGFVRDISERVRYERALEEARAAAERALAELRRANAELEERARLELALRTIAQSIGGALRVHEVMRQIAEGALAVSDASAAYVEQVIGPDGGVEVVATAGERTPPVGQHLPYPGSLTEEIIERREPAFLLRMEGLGAAMAPYLDGHCHGCSVLVVPLLADRAALGALVLLRRPEEPPFAESIVDRVRTLADLASLSLQRLAALAESERRRTEAEGAVRSRDEVLSIVSHDLRNPVSTVSMSAALLQDDAMDLSDEQRRKQLEIIARSAQRMNRLIGDLLDVARIEGGRLTVSCRCEDPAALAGEACDAFRPIAAEKSIALECHVEPGVRAVYADRDRLLQVLSNFLDNAVKFTPRGGRVALRVAPDGDGVAFAVSDTGPGIAAAERPHVFDRFWQARGTAHLGSGLGLAIAKGIAEAHRGTVRVESESGRGSTFSVTLPYSSECG